MKKVVSIAPVVFSLFLNGCVAVQYRPNPYYGSATATAGVRTNGALLNLIPFGAAVRGGISVGGPSVGGTISGYGVDPRRGMRYGYVHMSRRGRR